MKLFDSHCHLNDPAFEPDMDAVLARAGKASVLSMMIVGAGATGSARAVSLAESIPGCYASVGIHPHRAGECSEETLSHLRNLAKNPVVRAWGEIGLDFNRMYSPGEDQERWFVRQLECADELRLPVIFHERDSNGRLLEILREHPGNRRRGVIHCFSGNTSELEQYLGFGFAIGVTGIVTLKERGAGLRKQIPRIPVERILIETDAPYLTPAPEKSHTRRNEPAFVRSVLDKLAEIRGENPADLSAAIWKNTRRLFGH
jgi:TatD DNase family protein